MPPFCLFGAKLYVLSHRGVIVNIFLVISSLLMGISYIYLLVSFILPSLAKRLRPPSEAIKLIFLAVAIPSVLFFYL